MASLRFRAPATSVSAAITVVRAGGSMRCSDWGDMVPRGEIVQTARMPLMSITMPVPAMSLDRTTSVDAPLAATEDGPNLARREELGKVGGRRGRIARAMRIAQIIAGSRHNVRNSRDIHVTLVIGDVSSPPSRR